MTCFGDDAGWGGLTVSAAGVEFTAGVAGFTGNAADAAGDFSATIYWGDGSSSAGVIEGGHGAFVVHGTHTYAFTGTYTITVDVEDLDAATDSDTSTAQVGLILAGIEAELVVATFETLDSSLDESDFVATVTWGDETSNSSDEALDPGEDPYVWIEFANGVYTVYARHTYSDDSSEETYGVYDIGVIVAGGSRAIAARNCYSWS